MPTLAQVITFLKFGAVALVVAAFGFLWIRHNHDTKTIADQKQLLAQAGTQHSVDTAQIAQLRADLAQSNHAVEGLAAQTVIAYKAAQDAKVQAAKASAPILHEIDVLTQKLAAPEAKERTCSDAINEWRKRQ